MLDRSLDIWLNNCVAKKIIFVEVFLCLKMSWWLKWALFRLMNNERERVILGYKCNWKQCWPLTSLSNDEIFKIIFKRIIDFLFKEKENEFLVDWLWNCSY
jgi:hypothetical protein